MQYDYFEHQADTGIIGYGDSLEEAFVNAARALFAIMADPQQIPKTHQLCFKFVEADVELALVTWLNQLIARARVQGLILADFALNRNNNIWHAKASGAPWSDSITRGTEVKGATLTMLSVKQQNSHWRAACVVDV